MISKDKTSAVHRLTIKLRRHFEVLIVRNLNGSSSLGSLEPEAGRDIPRDELLEDLVLSAAPLARSVFSSPPPTKVNGDTRLTPRNGLSDLHMFLQEVGTDPKEARFWLKHFQSSVDPQRPFAVVQVQQEVIHDTKTLHSLCSCLSFLHRHRMQVVIVHGPNVPTKNSKEEYWAYRKQLTNDSLALVDALEYNEASSRPIFHGANVFQVHSAGSDHDTKLALSLSTIQWAMRSGSLVIIPSLGELSDGRLVPVNIAFATRAVAKELKPLKVLLINNHGGLTNEKGQVIANVNIANDLTNLYQASWCTSKVRDKMSEIVSLLRCLPSHSSVVISSATRLLAELFTHRGSGTFFKMAETITKHRNMKDVDGKKLSQLIESGFRRTLDEEYLEKLSTKLDTLYIVEGYSAAAIITRESGFPVPYLDKFVVSSSRSGESLGQMVWDAIREDFPQLFWRSRNTNIINTWYFMQCDGCRRFENWTVFWYGDIPEYLLSLLIEHTLSLPSSFNGIKNIEQEVRA